MTAEPRGSGRARGRVGADHLAGRARCRSARGRRATWNPAPASVGVAVDLVLAGSRRARAPARRPGDDDRPWTPAAGQLGHRAPAAGSVREHGAGRLVAVLPRLKLPRCRSLGREGLRGLGRWSGRRRSGIVTLAAPAHRERDVLALLDLAPASGSWPMTRSGGWSGSFGRRSHDVEALGLERGLGLRRSVWPTTLGTSTAAAVAVRRRSLELASRNDDQRDERRRARCRSRRPGPRLRCGGAAGAPRPTGATARGRSRPVRRRRSAPRDRGA